MKDAFPPLFFIVIFPYIYQKASHLPTVDCLKKGCFLTGIIVCFLIPTRLSFISENQSVDHHSKPFRGRMKGTFISSAKVLFLSENLAFPFNFQLI